MVARAFSSWWPLLSTGLAGFARKSDALAPKALALPCGNSASSASACSSPGPAAGAQTPGDSGGHVASGVSPGSRLFPEWGDSFRGAWALQPGAPVSLRPPAGVTLIRSHLVPARLSAAWREKLPALGSRRCDGPTGSISAENRGLVQPLGPRHRRAACALPRPWPAPRPTQKCHCFCGFGRPVSRVVGTFSTQESWTWGGGTKSPGWELSRGLGLAGVGAPGVGEGSQETCQKAPSSPPPSVRRPRAISGRQLPGPPRASQCCGLVPTR